MKKIKYYERNNKVPFLIWKDKLDNRNRALVDIRINRLKDGLLGDHRNLKNSIKELKFSNGLRVYYSEIENTILLLLCGGNKTRQSNDIKKAEEFLQDYIERAKND